MRLEHIGNAAIEALHHAIGLRRSGFCETVLNPQRLAQLIELVLARGCTLAAGKEPVGELLPLSVSTRVMWMGQALCKAARKALALAAVLLLLICTNTQRVARSMATNR